MSDLGARPSSKTMSEDQGRRLFERSECQGPRAKRLPRKSQLQRKPLLNRSREPQPRAGEKQAYSTSKSYSTFFIFMLRWTYI
jgi:hypothetical protein